jgi:hypothetical protein
LNPRKTGISEGPLVLDEGWVIELSRFTLHGRTPIGQLNDAVAFFSRAFELAHEHPRQAVLRYAIVTAQRWAFPAEGWRTFQALLLNAATADPGTLPVAIVVLDRHVTAGCAVNKTAFQRLIDSTIQKHAPLGHGSEVAWALWLAIQFEVDIAASTAERITMMEDDVVALLALDAHSRHLIPAYALDLNRWQTLTSLPGALNNEHWLLSYEANLKGWLPCPGVAAHPFFSVLSTNGISFYDPGRRLSNFTGAAAAVPGGWLPLTYS